MTPLRLVVKRASHCSCRRRDDVWVPIKFASVHLRLPKWPTLLEDIIRPEVQRQVVRCIDLPLHRFIDFPLAVIGGLLLCSGLLYVLDVYATTALDRYLLDHYGPELYERYTSEYDPDGNGFEIPVKRIESGEHGQCAGAIYGSSSGNSDNLIDKQGWVKVPLFRNLLRWNFLELSLHCQLELCSIWNRTYTTMLTSMLNASIF